MQTYEPGDERVLILPIENPGPAYITTRLDAEIDGIEDEILCEFPQREDPFEDLIVLQKVVGDPLVAADLGLESGLAKTVDVQEFLEEAILHIQNYLDERRKVKEKKKWLS